MIAGPIERIDKFEGDECPLKSGGMGVCRKTFECTSWHEGVRNERHCEFSGNNPVICCSTEPLSPYAQKAMDMCSKISTHSGPKLIDHVVGRTCKAGVGDFPFIGLLVYANPEERCGASLISKKFLVTAAHCIRAKPTSVRLGTISASDPLADTYAVANTIRHPDYSRKTKHNDIGLVEVRDEVEMNANIKPICMYTMTMELPSVTELKVIGWGINDTNRLEASDDLLSGSVRPVSRSSCQQKYSDHGLKFIERQMCAIGDQNAQGEYTDTCSGDSGGPLVLQKDKKYFLVGVSSTGSGCGSGTPGVYTRVASYLEWIVGKVPG